MNGTGGRKEEERRERGEAGLKGRNEGLKGRKEGLKGRKKLKKGRRGKRKEHKEGKQEGRGAGRTFGKWVTSAPITIVGSLLSLW
jgi:hypothetical protein